MISKYKENEKKYQLLLQYTNDCKLTKELEKKVLGTLGKYKMCVYGMELNKIEELIQECKERDSEKPLQKELHSVIFGSHDCTEYMDSKTIKDMNIHKTEKHSVLEI